jgi:uncharacterized protein (TIGR02646 family)
MKRIRKTHAPQALSDWIKENKDLNCKYDDLVGNPAHVALKAQLLKEQGYLCAYTGKRICVDTSHIEHLKPQNKCIDLEDVDYRNVVACFPKDGGNTSLGYGATFKGGWWDESEFVSPCQEGCERRFSFGWTGKVAPTLTDDSAAIKTIQILGLNKPETESDTTQNAPQAESHIQDIRRAAIRGFFGFGKNSKELTKAQAEQILRTISSPDPSTHHLQEFCFVLEQLLHRHIKTK